MGKMSNLGRGLAVGMIGAISVTTAGVGIATAANGGSLVLGHSNTATKTTTLKDKKGTPLSLVGKKSKPPLKVNSSKLVKHLNAAELGGLTANDLSTGSGAQRDWDLLAALGGGGSGFPVILLPHTTTSGSTTTFHPIKMAQTGALTAGNYFFSASALAESTEVFCYVSNTGAFPGTYQYGIAENTEAFETGFFTIKQSGQRLGEYCVNTDSTDDALGLSDSLAVVHVNHKVNGVQTPTNSTASVRKKLTTQ